VTEKAPQVSTICAECGSALEFPLGTVQVQCKHCQAGMAVDAGQRLLRLACPRCGGNFYYLDGALCGHCPFCDASLLALTRDRLLRYLVRPAVPAPEEGARLLQLPFWHVSGLVYGWDIGKKVEIVDPGGEVQQGQSAEDAVAMATPERRDSGPQRVFRGRVAVLSLADPATLAHGVTALGVRGAVFPMEPFSADAETIGEIVPPALLPQQARAHLEGRALDLAHGGLTHLDLQRADLVAEALSLFYYPYWVLEGAERKVWDAVSGQPERLSKPAPAPAPTSAGSAAFDELRILELSCQKCGHALLPGNNARVLPCPGCGLHWEVAGDGLQYIPAKTARALKSAGPRRLWLPFWRVEVKLGFDGKQASHVRDLREVLGLHSPPGPLPAADPDSPLAYYVPAFGALRAPRLDVAAREMTRLQPLLDEEPRGAGEVYNCFLSAEDARRLGYATLLQFLPPVARRLRSLRVSPGEIALWYVPFADEGRELENLITGHRYDRAIFRGVRH
jgi:DNA-directed RNA polymerase subunit RPC12/RpoP